ncbi:MAG TPA: Cys-tRNA(Pro) deacylase [Candidatus Copromorpha excrementigallinarum]|uniref:Cys-tRNA(Pro)/Cys-tRNA(Cys) deacylase n=1 Tax=Candidatus Allocopromorpha excrementigallinarum TaxID=2840742 RepID=A0A9D1HZG9_9FIRM|nr:Cys-tRNA(Pro) deacylase [Candidatus Copromorpha excrementigallinarum]
MSRKKDKHTHKTNAVRMVEAAGIPYKTYEYDAPEGFLDGLSVARALGQNPGQVFKTLVTAGAGGENYVCVIPVGGELDLKKAARHFGEKKMEMLRSKLLTQTTGYIKGGCSPVGMKKPLPTAIDISAEDFETIIVSGGKVGLQMELPLKELMKITGAETAPLTAD